MVAICPTRNNPTKGITGVGTSIGKTQVHSYGMNVNLKRVSNVEQWVKVTNMKETSKKVYLADSAFYATYSGINDWVFASAVVWYKPASNSEKCITLRHNNSANIAFLDGHVEALRQGVFKERTRYGITGGWSMNHVAIDL